MCGLPELINQKNNILRAWIAIEQLTEGSIQKKEPQYRQFEQNIPDFKTYFTKFMQQQQEKLHISDKLFQKAGIAVYCEIFPFQEIVEKLRQKYQIAATNEEVVSSEKFTFAIYFDKDLNFLSEKFFLTISGAIRLKGKLPSDFSKEEESLRDLLAKKFADGDFNQTFEELFKKYQFTFANARYAFVKNIENTEANLHSFFIDDLKQALAINTNNLYHYFQGFAGKRKNLDSNKNSAAFNPELLTEILQPKNYPLGRFPSNPDHPLAFMQQIAVNLALNDKNDLRSINGPPGTGKTTLLKEIFAELIVQQAAVICNYSKHSLKGTLRYNDAYKIAALPPEIANKAIIVASSNNGAVQNIVAELPQIEKIELSQFLSELMDVDYFKQLSNSEIKEHWEQQASKKVKKITVKPRVGKLTWGLFSLEGGKAKNLNSLLNKIELMVQNLKQPDFKSQPNAYADFKSQYCQLKNRRAKTQAFFEKIKPLPQLKLKKIKLQNKFIHEKKLKQDQLHTKVHQKQLEIESLKTEQHELEQKTTALNNQLKKLDTEKIELQHAFEVLKLQKPSLFWFKKMFKSVEATVFLNNLDKTQATFVKVTHSRKQLLDQQADTAKVMAANQQALTFAQKTINQAQQTYQLWFAEEKNKIEHLNQHIRAIEKLIAVNQDINIIDFGTSYANLQKSNFWFDRTYRIAQSNLFIQSLAVRKQFLYENVNHLQSAVIIWRNQNKYLAKENGEKLIKIAWDWINFAIPIIGTTFASFNRMFKHLGTDTLANLFVDEAGQAVPQASVGAIYRSKRVLVVGDPAQIEPVLTLDSNVLNLIAKNYAVTEKFISAATSVQSLVDAASQYGFQKDPDTWIGIPLWVHRRSSNPMFQISNKLSYHDLMVQGKSEKEGQTQWFNIPGTANDKFVQEQAEFLKREISKRTHGMSVPENDIFVITPFRNVARQLVKILDQIGFVKRNQENKPINVGTVHTFQGKEAKVVYFVLGADNSSVGAANWAVTKPNMMNVAVTRAKEEFYIIGDRKLYQSLGSNVVKITMRLLNANV